MTEKEFGKRIESLTADQAEELLSSIRHEYNICYEDTCTKARSYNADIEDKQKRIQARINELTEEKTAKTAALKSAQQEYAMYNITYSDETKFRKAKADIEHLNAEVSTVNVSLETLENILPEEDEVLAEACQQSIESTKDAGVLLNVRLQRLFEKADSELTKWENIKKSAQNRVRTIEDRPGERPEIKTAMRHHNSRNPIPETVSEQSEQTEQTGTVQYMHDETPYYGKF